MDRNAATFLSFPFSTFQFQCHHAHPPSRHPSLVFSPTACTLPLLSCSSCDRFCICRPFSLRSGDATQRKGRRRGWPSRAELNGSGGGSRIAHSLNSIAHREIKHNLNTNNEANCTNTSAAPLQQQQTTDSSRSRSRSIRAAPSSPSRPAARHSLQPIRLLSTSIFVHRTPANAHCHPTKRTRTREQGTHRSRGQSDQRATIGQIFDCSQSMGKQRWSGAEQSVAVL